MTPILISRNTHFQMQWRGFTISVTDDEADRETAFRIRHDVFLDELGDKPRDDRRERDGFDDHYDHLLVTVTGSREPVGTCRLVSSATTDRFYSDSEFTIAPFLRQPGIKVELGRVCLARNWRRNLSFTAVGRGIGEYVRRHSAEWIFGCSSIATIEPSAAARLMTYFRDIGACDRGFGISPRPEHVLPGWEQEPAAGPESTRHDPRSAEALIPPLLKLYLKTGAGIGLAPALDHDFGCLDFFTVVALRDHQRSLLGRYIPC